MCRHDGQWIPQPHPRARNRKKAARITRFLTLVRNPPGRIRLLDLYDLLPHLPVRIRHVADRIPRSCRTRILKKYSINHIRHGVPLHPRKYSQRAPPVTYYYTVTLPAVEGMTTNPKAGDYTIEGITPDTPTTNAEIESGIQVYVRESVLHIRLDNARKAAIVNAGGHIVRHAQLDAGENRIEGLPGGIYFVRVEGEKAAKVMVR